MEQNRNKQTHRYREQTSGYQWGEWSEEGQDRGIRLRDINYYWGSERETQERGGICIHAADSLCCTIETNTTF